MMSNLSNFLVVQKKALSKNLSIKYMGKKIPVTGTHYKEYLNHGMPYIVCYSGKSNHIGWEFEIYNLETGKVVQPNKIIALDYLAPKFASTNLNNQKQFERVNEGYIIKEDDGKNVLLTDNHSFKETENHKLFFDHLSRSGDGTIDKVHVYEIKNNKYKAHFLVGANKMFGGTKNFITGKTISNPYELLHSIKYSGHSLEGKKVYHGSFSKQEFFKIVNNYFNNLVKSGKAENVVKKQKLNLFLNLEETFREFTNYSETELSIIEKKLEEEKKQLLKQFEEQKDKELEGRYSSFEEYLNDSRYKTHVTHNYNYHKLRESGNLVKLRAEVHGKIKQTILQLRNELASDNNILQEDESLQK